MLNSTPLASLDPEIQGAITAELGRQQSHIELIASENFAYRGGAGGRRLA